MSLDDLDEVPEAKSSFSTRAVRSPRLAASRATPAPVMPPPMTSTSKCWWARRARASDRSNPPAPGSATRAGSGMAKACHRSERDPAGRVGAHRPGVVNNDC
jgi:hypothetical protein